MTRRLLTPQQLCERLAIPKSTLYGWRQTGGGPPARKIGRLLRYDADEFELWLDEQKSERPE